MISVSGVSKRYASGLAALDNVDLDIAKGEIFALLGPNGAGKTTLIGVICGIVSMTSGQRARRRARHRPRLSGDALDGRPGAAGDRARHLRKRVEHGLLTAGACSAAAPTIASSNNCCATSRCGRSAARRIVELSGGMKRRVMIAKALSHEPDVVFLDEPTAGVDVNLRRDMWALVRKLRDKGVTVILTTHYIEEAEEMADRIGVINGGKIILVQEKTALMRKLGKRRLTLTLRTPLSAIPPALADWPLQLDDDGRRLVYSFSADAEGAAIPDLLGASANSASTTAISRLRRARSKTFSSTSSTASA